MNCEQVEELLSAYLDNALALEERHGVATHLQSCSQCSAILADFRRFDALIAHLPRLSPDLALRNRIFSSSRYLELTGTADAVRTMGHPTVPHPRTQRDTAHRPKLVVLPGGRSSSASPTSSRQLAPLYHLYPQKRQGLPGLRLMQAMIAAVLLLTVGVTSYIGWNLWHAQAALVEKTFGITPPAGLLQGPIPAGTRFVFLRDGTLWSGPTDGSTQIVRLTPQSVTVGASWSVRPALPGHNAGDMLAYIDLQKGFIHLIRSDGQSDRVIQQPLLKDGTQPALVWDTETGTAILNSLTWSRDGSMLAFVADPQGIGQTTLYIYSTLTGQVHGVSLPLKGSISHLAWSPDSIRIAFTFAHNGDMGILDYNTQNHGILTIISAANAKVNSGDGIVTFGWSSDVNVPAITWSVGREGQIHSIWQRHIGINGMVTVQELAQGNYAQALYNQSIHQGHGGWLLISSVSDHTGDIEFVDLTGSVRRLTGGKQASFVQWSPDGMHMSYLDAVSSGIGTLHLLDGVTGRDTVLATGVADDPLPAWSADNKYIAYSTGTHTFVVDVLKAKAVPMSRLQGSPSVFAWCATQRHQFIVALADDQQGIYLVDAQHATVIKLDNEGAHGPVLWTQIP